ncbi:hypothetical protein BJX99DRAFT_233665 [Aspergillus californicus]
MKHLATALKRTRGLGEACLWRFCLQMIFVFFVFLSLPPLPSIRIQRLRCRTWSLVGATISFGALPVHPSRIQAGLSYQRLLGRSV